MEIFSILLYSGFRLCGIHRSLSSYLNLWLKLGKSSTQSEKKLYHVRLTEILHHSQLAVFCRVGTPQNNSKSLSLR